MCQDWIYLIGIFTHEQVSTPVLLTRKAGGATIKMIGYKGIGRLLHRLEGTLLHVKDYGADRAGEWS